METLSQTLPPLAAAPVKNTPAMAGSSGRSRLLILLGLVLVGSAPLLYWAMAGLLQRPHYQFVVFVPIGVWLLIVNAPKGRGASLGGLGTAVAVLLLAVSLGVVALASYVWSPWIASVGVSAATFAIAWWYFGRDQMAAWLPVWVFCNVLIPPPFGMDEDLIVRLRTVTTRMTSHVLDQMGILHLSYANVIELPDKPLFIADACSGIHSLFVLLGVALFLGLFCKRSPLHIVLLLVSTFGIVLFENVARLVSVAAGLRWRVDLSEGSEHFVLGALLFALSLLLVFSTDQLLMFLLPEHPLRPARWLLSKFGIASYAKKSVPSGANIRRRGEVPIFGLACLFPLLGLFQLTNLPAQAPDLSGLMGQEIDLPQLGLEGLPQELAGFERQGFHFIKRVPGDPFGQSSQQWTYRSGDMTAMISLDYPYEGVHDSSVCYTQTGWSLRDEEVLEPSPDESVATPAVGRVRMNRALEGEALLLFGMADLHGHQTAIIKDLARGEADQRLADRFDSFSRTPEQQAADGAGIRPPCIQFQLLGRSHLGLDEPREQQLLDLFLQARRRLYEQCLAHTSEGEP